MVRALMVFSTLVLVLAGFVFVLTFVQIFQGMSSTNWDPGIPIKEKLAHLKNTEDHHQESVSPLVKQAEAFAQYLNSSQARKSQEVQIPTSRQIQSMSIFTSSKTTPKFKLLSTIHYRSRPDESMALISEPGSGTRWVKKGAYLGHFLVEKIQRGTIIYRNGNQLSKMLVEKKVPIRIERAPRITMRSVHMNLIPSRSSKASTSYRKNSKLLHKLGLSRPETQHTFGHKTQDIGQ